MAKVKRICRTPEECFEAGRAGRRARGDKLTDAQRARFAELLRPYADQLLDTEPAAGDAA